MAGASLVASPPAAAAACSFPTPDPLPSADGLIQDAADLQWLRDTTSAWSGAWTQTANIDMGGCEWDSSIGDSTNSFTGTYDGGGFLISGLSIARSSTNTGLFGVTADSVIRNLGFSGTVSGTSDVGGLVGEMVGGFLTNVYATGSVTGTLSDVGGLIGYLKEGTVTDSYATGPVTGGSASVGGLIGEMDNGSISRVFATGNITATNPHSGGLIGRVAFGSVVDAYASGDVTSQGDDVGGLIGQNDGASISRSFATGNVSSTGTLGDIGGLIGRNTGGSVSDCYATGSVSGLREVGGLVGNNSAPITNCYSIGSVTDTTDPPLNEGGLIGSNDSSVTNSFWDIETSAMPTSAGGVGKTTVQMKSLSTFSDAGWAITESCSSSFTWGICTEVNSGYPYLSALSALTRVAVPQGRFVDFIYLLPDGRECTSISPQLVQVGAMHVLPGEDALCRTSEGSLVAGWVIPVLPGFTGYGSVHEPFPPGLPVRVTDSQRFTLVPYEQTLQVDYDANIAADDACTSADVLHGSQDGRVEFVWVPRADFSMARTPSQAPCQPEGHELMGWNTSGDGTGEVIGLGEPLPEDWATDRINHHTVYATWRAV